MQIEIQKFPRPILVIDEFLPEDKAQEVLQECIDLKPVYQPARVLGPNKDNAIDTKMRQNDVVYIDPVFANNRENSRIVKNALEQGLWTPERRVIWRQHGLAEIIGLSTRSETILSRYGNCDFYGWHMDPSDNIAQRLVTVVYYVNKIPAMFTGGQIEFREDDQSLIVEPMNNRAVVFPSNTLHKVSNVRIEGDEFENGRFSLNIWLGFQQ